MTSYKTGRSHSPGFKLHLPDSWGRSRAVFSLGVAQNAGGNRWGDETSLPSGEVSVLRAMSRPPAVGVVSDVVAGVVLAVLGPSRRVGALVRRAVRDVAVGSAWPGPRPTPRLER